MTFQKLFENMINFPLGGFAMKGTITNIFFRRESYFPIQDVPVSENQRAGEWSDQSSNKVNLISRGQHLSYG